jgi:nucleotide-binding universal stress UspA family protein
MSDSFQPTREVLLATDFSPCSETAAEVAVELARREGARLHVLHVASPQDAVAITPELARFADQLGAGTTPPLVKAIEIGPPAQEIVRYATRNRIDLIVMGTHGRTGLARVARGSVAETVVRTAPCGVLTVKLRERDPILSPAPAAVLLPASHCLLCASPAGGSICETCMTRVTAEARERKRRELGHRS